MATIRRFETVMEMVDARYVIYDIYGTVQLHGTVKGVLFSVEKE